MDRFRIVGPTRLAGTVAASGAKNAALPELAATLLTDEPVVLGGVPQVRDIATMRRLLAHLGVEQPTATATCGSSSSARRRRGRRRRAVRAGEDDARERPGARPAPRPPRPRARLAARRLRHRRAADRPAPAGLEALGAAVTLEHGYVDGARRKRLVGARFRFDVPTVTGTENLLMAAALARGETVLENCAREPEVVDLARLLVAMGAEIEGAGAETIRSRASPQLGGAEHAIISRPDRGRHLSRRRRDHRRRRHARRRRSGRPRAAARDARRRAASTVASDARRDPRRAATATARRATS